MELNTSQPQHSQIVSKPSRNPILYIVCGVVIITIVLLALLIWQQKQQIASVANELTNTQKLNEELTKARQSLENKAVQKEDAPSKTGDENAQVVALAESYQKAASITTYDYKVEKLEAEFARVSFKTPYVEQCFYKKVDGTWTQIFCGVVRPSSALIKQYGIPTTLTTY
ncbi:MAG: hypothetical protein ABIQ64_03775 [Candidatus Saccharimonadales bacterium]